MAKTVLIIDDSRTLREMINFSLSKAGYEVLEAQDGQVAIEILQQNKVHLIICDVNMPVMDGLTFVKHIKQIQQYKFLPIIMLTTENQENKKIEGKQAGAKAWIVKPFKAEQLIGAVQKLIRD